MSSDLKAREQWLAERGSAVAEGKVRREKSMLSSVCFSVLDTRSTLLNIYDDTKSVLRRTGILGGI